MSYKSLKVKVLTTQSCPTLCDTMDDCSPPGSSVHGDSSEKNTGVGLPYPTPWGSSWSRDRTQVSCIAGRFLTIWATSEVKFHKTFIIFSSFMNCCYRHTHSLCTMASLCPTSIKILMNLTPCHFHCQRKQQFGECICIHWIIMDILEAIEFEFWWDIHGCESSGYNSTGWMPGRIFHRLASGSMHFRLAMVRIPLVLGTREHIHSQYNLWPCIFLTWCHVSQHSGFSIFLEAFPTLGHLELADIPLNTK